jgi:hypothetical protein
MKFVRAKLLVKSMQRVRAVGEARPIIHVRAIEST